jgi:hypothetical protein
VSRVVLLNVCSSRRGRDCSDGPDLVCEHVILRISPFCLLTTLFYRCFFVQNWKCCGYHSSDCHVAILVSFPNRNTVLNEVDGA